LGAITPAVNFVVSPLWSALADTTGILFPCFPYLSECPFVGKHQMIMLTTFIGSVLVRCLLTYSNNNVKILSMIVVVSAILYAPVKPLLDSTVMAMLTDKSLYGRSRLFGQFGFGLGSFIVDRVMEGNIKIMFFVHLLLSFPTALLMYFFNPSQKITDTGVEKRSWLKSSRFNPFNPQVKKEPVNRRIDIINGLKHTLGNSEVLIFFTIVFIVGISSGIVENFAYVRLAELDSSSRSIFGPLRLASSITGSAMFWISGLFIKNLGVNGVMVLSLISYILRFFIYGSVRNAWHALPAEMLRGLTFALFWSSATFYVYEISPKHLTATMVRSFFPFFFFSLHYLLFLFLLFLWSSVGYIKWYLWWNRPIFRITDWWRAKSKFWNTESFLLLCIRRYRYFSVF
jgi:hypothetical protein